MRGRIFGIKKTTILAISFYLAIVLIITATLLTTLLYKNYFVWFFFFCLFAGGHLLVKALLFRIDSSCYFGFLLFFVGLVGVLVQFLGLFELQSVYFILAFALASFATYCFFRQRFQLSIALILFSIALAWFFYKINLLPFWIFIAILCAGVLSFILKYLIKSYTRKRS